MCEQVKESLKWYHPERDPRERFRRNDQANPMNLKSIRAEASVRIKALAAGFLIGKNGQQIRRIIRETDVDRLDVSSKP